MTTKLPKLTDDELVLLYRQWSEETFAASFRSLHENGSIPALFLNWLLRRQLRVREPYEEELISRWRKAEERT